MEPYVKQFLCAIRFFLLNTRDEWALAIFSIPRTRILFIPQGIDRIGGCGFDGLKTDRKQSDTHGDKP